MSFEKNISFSEFSKETRKLLAYFVRELKEQWLINAFNINAPDYQFGEGEIIRKQAELYVGGSEPSQFWFFPKYMYNKDQFKLSDLRKCLQALAVKDVLHFTWISNLGVLNLHNNSFPLETGYPWGLNVVLQAHEIPKDLLPALIVDFYNSDFDNVIDKLSVNKKFYNYYIDDMGMVSYNGVPVQGINNSYVRKRVFATLLESDNHVISVEKILDIKWEDARARNDRDVINRGKDSYIIDERSNVPDLIYHINKVLRRNNRRIVIEEASRGSGNQIETYKLINRDA